jgi:hypothetical protein
MAPTATGLQARFLQFASTDTDYIDIWLAEAALRFTPARFGAQWDMAAYLFACHSMVLFPATEAAAGAADESRGAITGEKVGDLSRNYADGIDMARVPASLMDFTATTYGRKLIGIILSRRHATPMVILTGSSRASTTESDT